MAKCVFCGTNIQRGTGMMYVKVDGRVMNFCSKKCEKSVLKFNKKPRETKWTEEYQSVKKGLKV